jgi:hypothetical protein
MKLTTLLREAFVKQVMNDVPQVNYDEEVIKRLDELTLETLPPKLLAVYEDKELRQYLDTWWYYSGHGGSGGRSSYQAVCSELVRSVFDADPILANIFTAKASQYKNYQSLEKKLKAVAASCTTTKALREALPEFDKYIPDDAQTLSRSVPDLANVVSDFVKAGWPKAKG